MNYVASPHFKVNSQPVCFLGFLSKMTNWGSNSLLKPFRMASPVFSLYSWGKMHSGWSVAVKLRGSERGVWCQGLLCVAVFVWVCQSACRVPCARVCRLTTPLHVRAWCGLIGQISASELVFCSPDEPKVREDAGFGWVVFFSLNACVHCC